MPTKAEQYAQMAEKVTVRLTSSWQEWTDFLTTAARLYKYPFHEQMMIYAQRPDATACAEYDLWNNQMGRYVRRGSKGIALVDDSGDRLRLRYVFDISDTGTREHSRTPWLWTLEEAHTALVTSMLESCYEVTGSALSEQLTRVAEKLADAYWTENRQDILYSIDSSFLEKYDEFNIGVQFRTAASVSIAYALVSRCGLEPERYFGHEDFMPIFDFNTPAAVRALGTAVSQISGQVLRQIGVTIRNAEREAIEERRTQHEESRELHSEWRLSDSLSGTGRAAVEATGQVRQDAQSVPEGTSAYSVQSYADERDTLSASGRDRRDSESTPETDDAAAGRSGGGYGEAESQQPDEMGRPDVYLQGAGGRNPVGGTYQQLTLNLFLSEAEQIQSIDEGSSVQTPDPFSIPNLFGQNITREGDTITIGNGGPVHEIDITVSDEQYEAIQKAIPEEKAYDPTAPVYREGDTVYLEKREYQITELRKDTVQLLPSGMSYPIYRTESLERFEQLLKNDLRNGSITEYLYANPEKVDQDLRELLAFGLLTWQDKVYISRWLRDGEGNREIAQRLSELYSGREETMALVTGNIADYRTFTTGVEIEIRDHEERKMAALAYSWSDVAPILRGLYVREQDDFFQNPEKIRRYAVEEATGGHEGLFVIWDRQIRDFHMTGGFIFWGSQEEAERAVDQLNQTTLEGSPSYQVGDQVMLPAPDHPITGIIDAIEDATVRIYTGPYAWSYDVISREQFEAWLRQDERNARLFTPDIKERPAPEITSEPVTVYPGDKNGLPYDVVVEQLHIDEKNGTDNLLKQQTAVKAEHGKQFPQKAIQAKSTRPSVLDRLLHSVQCRNPYKKPKRYEQEAR